MSLSLPRCRVSDGQVALQAQKELHESPSATTEVDTHTHTLWREQEDISHTPSHKGLLSSHGGASSDPHTETLLGPHIV